MAETSTGRAANACALVPQIARGVLVLIALVSCASAAQAEPALSLAWSAPDACPDRGWAEQRIAAQLAGELSVDVAQGVRASVTIARSAGGYALSLRTSVAGAAGQRTIEGGTCQELAEAAALIIALSVSEASEHSAKAGTSETPSPPPSTAVKDARATKSKEHVALLALRIDALLDVGFLAPLGYGPAFAVAYQYDIWRAEVAALWITPRVVEADNAEAGSVRASLWAVRAGGCALFGRRRIQGGPCAGGEFGQARGTGAGELTPAARARHPWLAAFLGARVNVGLIAKLSLIAEADLAVSLARPRFVSSVANTPGRELVHEPSVAQLRVNAGLELRF